MNIEDINEIDLDNILKAYINSLLMFHHACDSNIFSENKLPKMQAELGINTDIPIAFAGISHSLCFEEPQYFFSKQVMNEIFNKLQDSNSNNEEMLIEAVLSFQEPFFAAINSYSNIIDIYNDLNEASFEAGFKNKNISKSNLCTNSRRLPNEFLQVLFGTIDFRDRKRLFESKHPWESHPRIKEI